jgi:hypothetical protein
MRRYGYWHGGHCGCHWHGWHGGYGPAWAWEPAATKDEVLEDMQDYKAELEAEITALEKRINTLREKQ